MQIPTGKLIAIGGAEDKGTEVEKGELHKNNLNFFELGYLTAYCGRDRRH
jgi:cyanophycinase